ncbi:putative SnoaL-like aldol condensation-catalyzing enzyme [Shimia isoporae]|uniref:Putative SnoaL-like aldol condensation-catalyzing enzyme n=1 Tax=Shimia isoporae TaxID=647720 RepID=A0A4R1NJG8_9RHOB|nr:nuclear transport factor 2 family protein [Shimia isoporae]TCL08406.1 putative SnoaL-like aldol condensation-catalyzing enzyme [Shimia isoporae]
MSAKEIVIQLATALFSSFDPEAATALLDPGYIQHNPAVPTGAAAIVGFVPALEQSGFQAETHRVIAEGDLVVLHSTFSNAQIIGADTVIAFDVFRVKDGKVVEHWDNLQPAVPAAQTANGNSMVDGAVEIMDLEKTAQNKALVQGMLSDVFMGGKVDKIADYISAETYVQHNPQIGNGLEGLGAAIAQLSAAGQMFTYDTVHMVVAEGNFVFAASEGSMGGVPMAFFDLFRVEDGKIVEHWDVVSDIPAEMAHENGKF